MNPTKVNPLRIYLGSLADRIGKDDLNSILFYAEELTDRPIKKQERENIKDARSLLVKLQEVGHIDDKECSVLVQLLEEANLYALAKEVKVRYDIGFNKDISDRELREIAQDHSAQKPPEADIQIPCETCKSYFKELGEELEKKYAKTKNLSLQRALRERNDAESDVKQWEGRLESIVQEKNTLERQIRSKEKQLEMGKKEIERVKHVHQKEKENLEKAKSKSELLARQIQDKMGRVIQEKEKLEQELTEKTHEVGKMEDLNRENETFKRAHDKLEADIKKMEEVLKRVTQEKNTIEEQLENQEKLEKRRLKEVQDRLDSAIKERDGLERELEVTNRKVKQVEDFHKKEKEKIQAQLDRVIKERERLEKQLSWQLTTPGKSASKVEAKPIGGTKYIGEKETLEGSKWTVQVLGSMQSGTEPGQFNYPNGLAWHGDQLVICDTENHRIQILNKNKVVIEIIRFDGQFDKEFKPLDVAISPDGHFFITDIGNNQIIICDQNKKIIQIIPQSADIEVRSITVMAAFIFVTDSKGKSLIKYNIKDGKLVARVSDQFSNPRSVMATSNNHLLESDFNKHVIHVLDSDLNFLNSYRNDRFKSPQGLDVDSHGNIYICRWDSSGIVKLRSDGQLDCVLFEDVGYYPEFIAVNDDITTTIATTDQWSVHQISVYSVST